MQTHNHKTGTYQRDDNDSFNFILDILLFTFKPPNQRRNENVQTGSVHLC